MALSLTTVVLLTIVTLGTVHSYYLRSYSGKRNFNHGENSIKRNQVRQNIALQKKGGHGSHEHGKKKGDKIDKEIETLIKLLSLLKEDEMQEIKENISKGKVFFAYFHHLQTQVSKVAMFYVTYDNYFHN